MDDAKSVICGAYDMAVNRLGRELDEYWSEGCYYEFEYDDGRRCDTCGGWGPDLILVRKGGDWYASHVQTWSFEEMPDLMRKLLSYE